MVKLGQSGEQGISVQDVGMAEQLLLSCLMGCRWKGRRAQCLLSLCRTDSMAEQRSGEAGAGQQPVWVQLGTQSIDNNGKS